jgi:hypothetical protein
VPTDEKILGLLRIYNSRVKNLASGGIKPPIKKIQAVIDWEIPKNVRRVQTFLGFTNCYRRFIRDFSSIASPLYNLTEKEKRSIGLMNVIMHLGLSRNAVPRPLY